MAQVDVQPPKFILFVNYPEPDDRKLQKIHLQPVQGNLRIYRRPHRIYLKGKEKKDRPNESGEPSSRKSAPERKKGVEEFDDEMQDDEMHNDELDYKFENE